MPLLAHFEELEPTERRRAARRALKLGIGPKDPDSGVEQVIDARFVADRRLARDLASDARRRDLRV